MSLPKRVKASRRATPRDAAFVQDVLYRGIRPASFTLSRPGCRYPGAVPPAAELSGCLEPGLMRHARLPHAATERRYLPVYRQREHRLAELHIGNPLREERVKNMRVRIADLRDAGNHLELVRKAERRAGPGSLDRR